MFIFYRMYYYFYPYLPELFEKTSTRKFLENQSGDKKELWYFTDVMETLLTSSRTSLSLCRHSIQYICINTYEKEIKEKKRLSRKRTRRRRSHAAHSSLPVGAHTESEMTGTRRYASRTDQHDWFVHTIRVFFAFSTCMCIYIYCNVDSSEACISIFTTIYHYSLPEGFRVHSWFARKASPLLRDTKSPSTFQRESSRDNKRPMKIIHFDLGIFLTDFSPHGQN